METLEKTSRTDLDSLRSSRCHLFLMGSVAHGVLLVPRNFGMSWSSAFWLPLPIHLCLVKCDVRGFEVAAVLLGR